MALVEIYHVVAANRTVATDETIKEGQIVSLNSSGEVVLQGSSSSCYIPYGIAGDTKSDSTCSMPGVAAGWQGRASDYFDETKASGKMTVYHSGGEFATDQFTVNVASSAVMANLYAYNGLLHDANTQSTVVVGILLKGDGVYPSGVPGVDINGDMALSGDNSNTYIEFKLVI